MIVHRAMLREKKTIEAMTRIYCQDLHGGKELCEECSGVLSYAFLRIDHCVFGPEKPACNDCKIHCYKPAMREKVRRIMRYAGPKMVYRHPVMSAWHLMKKIKNKTNGKETI